MRRIKDFFILSLIILFLSIYACNKIDRCAFVTSFDQSKLVEWNDLANWLCLANLSTGLNSSYNEHVETPNGNEITLYGLFAIKNRWWCKDEEFPDGRNGCNMNCSYLLDDNIEDDIDCALKVHDLLGFSYREDWNIGCQGVNLIPYLNIVHDCRVVEEDLIHECDFVETIYENEAEFSYLPDWLCIASKGAKMNTSQVIPDENDPSYWLSYGIFQISDQWCKWSNNNISETPCNIFCNHFLDNNIVDDFECAKWIYQENGFNYWPLWERECQDTTEFKNLIDNCDWMKTEIISECDFAENLKKNGEFLTRIPKWLCLADSASNLNKTYKKVHSELQTDYGLFSISNEWCKDEQNPYDNRCNIDCSELTDSMFRNDFACAQNKFQNEGGFKSWQSYNESCQEGEILDRYKDAVASCSFTGPEIIDECELIEFLYNATALWHEIPDWLCLVKYASDYNTTRVHIIPQDDRIIVHYGLFALTNIWWCHDDFYGGTIKDCPNNCTDFLKRDISEAYKCALEVKAAQGFTGWDQYKQNCEGKDESKYIDLMRTCKYSFPTKDPEIISNNAEPVLTVGTFNKQLICDVESEPAPFEIYWSYDRSKPEIEIIEDKSNTYRSILIFREVFENHTGEYTCIVNHLLEKEKFTFKVKTIMPPEVKSDKDFPLLAIIAISVGSLLFVTLAILFLKYRNNSKKNQVFNRKEIEEFKKGIPHLVKEEGLIHENAQFIPYNSKFEISKKDFKINFESILGMGEFGIVYKGIYNNFQPVAIKTLKPLSEKSYIIALLSEIKIMIHIGNHSNILNLVGAYTSELSKGDVCLILELCPMGNLENFLNKNRDGFRIDGKSRGIGTTNYVKRNKDNGLNMNIPKNNIVKFSIKNLYCWANQIANGMEYLSTKNVIHGDLATRNILLFGKNSIKITDFGLSRQLYKYKHYIKKKDDPLPFRWMAIESITRMLFSTESDIWAYGVTLWEIFTLGEVPYFGINMTEEFIKSLENDTRLSKPQLANEETYKMMKQCWAKRPENRPNFTALKNFFTILEHNHAIQKPEDNNNNTIL